MVGIPLVLPMGWKLSPLFFCSYTASVADLANRAVQTKANLPEHTLEQVIQALNEPMEPTNPQAIQPPSNHQLAAPLSYIDVYMDDFIGLSQAPTKRHTQRAILHSIDTVFRAERHPDDPIHRKDVISRSKLANRKTNN